MVDDEKYVDFNWKPLTKLGYVGCELQVCDQYVKMVGILVARKGVKSIIGWEWLSRLNLEIAPKSQNKGELIVKWIEKEEIEKLGEETQCSQKNFPNYFQEKKILKTIKWN